MIARLLFESLLFSIGIACSQCPLFRTVFKANGHHDPSTGVLTLVGMSEEAQALLAHSNIRETPLTVHNDEPETHVSDMTC